MDYKKIEEIQRNIVEFLHGKNNNVGEEIFHKWAQKKKEDKTPIETPLEIESQIKKNIDDRIVQQEKRNERLYKSRKIGGTLPVGIKLLKVAATIAILVSIFIVARNLVDKNEASFAEAPLKNEIRTVPFGEKIKLKLTDGSMVILNSGTEFRFPETFGDSIREVFLNGEAFFNVARNEDKPFVIQSGDIKTTVLGTSFNIKAFEEENRSIVTVVSGKVKVDVKSDETAPTIYLTPNYQARFNNETMTMTKVEVKAVNYIDWKDNILNFDNMSLDEIAGVLERWYNVDVQFTDHSVRDIYFLGKYQDPSLKGVLESVKFITNIDFELQDSTVIFKGQTMK